MSPAAMKPNLAKVSQSYRKLKVVFGYKTKQFVDILVKMLVRCANLHKTMERAWQLQRGLVAAREFRGILRRSEAPFREGSRLTQLFRPAATSKMLRRQCQDVGLLGSPLGQILRRAQVQLRGRAREAPGGQIKSLLLNQKNRRITNNLLVLRNPTKLTKNPKNRF